MSIQIALLRYFPYKLSSLVAKKIKSKALAADCALESPAAPPAAARCGSPRPLSFSFKTPPRPAGRRRSSAASRTPDASSSPPPHRRRTPSPLLPRPYALFLPSIPASGEPNERPGELSKAKLSLWAAPLRTVHIMVLQH